MAPCARKGGAVAPVIRSRRSAARVGDSARTVVQKIKGGEPMAKITKTLVGESLVGEGNEVAHVDLIMGPRGGAVEAAFCNALTNNKDGFTSLLAVVAPHLLAKPHRIRSKKVR